MRGTDRDLTSVLVVRADSAIYQLADLAGATGGYGAVDSPQATLLPLGLLQDLELTVRHAKVGVGLHGDHIGGEREAARALVAGDVDAACVLDANHLIFTKEGTLPAGDTVWWPRLSRSTTATCRWWALTTIERFVASC